MQNDVPTRSRPEGLATRAVERALEARRATYEDEVQRLLTASFSLIQQSGDLEPPVGAIVKAAGLSNQAFYRHFRSKDELLLATLDEGVGRLADYLGHRMESAEDPVARVRAWIGGVLEQALQDTAAEATRPFAGARARLAQRFPAEVEASERRLTALLADALRDAAAAGVLRSDPEHDAETIYTLAMGWVQRRLAHPEPASRAEAEHVIAFALRGLGAP